MAERSDVTQDEVKELTEQFYVTLRAYVARLSPQDQARSPKSFQQIQDLLSGGRAVWSDAYEIEQLMVDLFDERTLEIELQSRLLEAESNLRPAVNAQYAKLAGTLTAPADRRALLARLVNDLQWRYTVTEVRRSYSKEITKTTGLIFMIAIALFALMVLFFALVPSASDTTRDSITLLIAALAGAWGASFSMLSSVKGRVEAADLNDLKLMRGSWILWSRPLIGVGAAAILYFFMTSGLLGGTAFPTLTDARDLAAAAQTPGTAPGTSGAPAATATRRTQLALLIVWCFLAGFSERLVPSLLAKTEDRAAGHTAAPEPDRFKPDVSAIAASTGTAAAKGAPQPPSSGSPGAAPAGDAVDVTPT